MLVSHWQKGLLKGRMARWRLLLGLDWGSHQEWRFLENRCFLCSGPAAKGGNSLIHLFMFFMINPSLPKIHTQKKGEKGFLWMILSFMCIKSAFYM